MKFFLAVVLVFVLADIACTRTSWGPISSEESDEYSSDLDQNQGYRPYQNQGYRPYQNQGYRAYQN